ncbi:MAG: RecQ family ATP-dependent DNA helicase, partial [Saprospiraceae bacterium]
MPEIVFFDTELDPRSGKILDIGAFREPDQPFHNSSLSEFKSFIMGSGIFSGHNIFHHDLKAIKAEIESVCRNPIYIDTLYLAPLLFPKIPYHRLLKDDKLQIDDLNNPLNDALKARQLFYDEVSTFNDLEDMLKEMYFRLLGPSNEFSAFFHFVNYQSSTAASLEESIREKFQGDICSNAPISSLIFEHPVSLAYCLSLIHVRDQYSIIPRWLSKTRPEVESIMVLLRDKLCPSGCAYCNKALDIH